VTQARTISIALQGGGSHGAFTLGALKRLAAQPDLSIDAITGTSSGAVNGALLCQGLLGGARDPEAVTAPLTGFWRELGEAFDGIFTPLPELGDVPFMAPGSGRFSLEWFLKLTENFAPYVINPAALNPLRDLLERYVDFEALRRTRGPRLFVSATNVRTGKLKIFAREELTAEHILASACLPSLHHSVSIDGETYWDGGFAGNPPVFPLIFDSDARDIVIILVNPLTRDEVPTTADEIRARMSEIAFNANFMREMRAITFSKRFIRQSWFALGALERRLNQTRIHVVHGDEFVREYRPKSRYNASSELIDDLSETGHRCFDAWLARHGEEIGVHDTADLEGLFE